MEYPHERGETMTEPLYAISHDGHGSGGFMCPPGHWNHEYTLNGYYGGRRKANADSISGIGYALEEDSGASESVKERVRRIMDAATLTDSDMWERSVYGYFRYSYAPENGDRNVSNAISDHSDSLPAERHLAVLCIREYFPDHEPRLDLIADPGKGYGSYPCVKCGERVQYEARFDALAFVKPHGGYGTECPRGGKHER
jgi:hypothetical protein